MPAYLRDANAAVFVYDPNRIESFNNIKNWIQLYREHQSLSSVTALVATKIDLLDEGKNSLRESSKELAS